MQIKIDDSLCIGCGLCVDACKEVFSMNSDGKAVVVQHFHGGDADFEEIRDMCPVDAIEIDQ